MGFLDKQPRHEPGGTRRWPLIHGMRGTYCLSPDERYRYYLRRVWDQFSDDSSEPFALWIGMNPSTATDNMDDPTVRWETIYTQRYLMCTRYVKCNVFAFRSTNPKNLLTEPDPIGPNNSRYIRYFAQDAAVIVCAWGKLPRQLQYGPDRIEKLLRSIGAQPKCLGLNSDGSPKHPLYLKHDTPLVDYD
jgi:hypothetical protein